MTQVDNSNVEVEKDTLRIDWCRRSITETDWIVLREVIKARGIKKVVEFGSGISTQVMDRFGIEVHSFETMPIQIERVKLLVHSATFIQWEGKYPPVFTERYELAFIDGPCGGENREPSYKAVADSNVPIVACHDYKREIDNKWIEKYFCDWKEVARNDESIAGLLILERTGV